MEIKIATIGDNGTVWHDAAEEEEGTTISEYEAYQRYDDMLDECYGTVEIAGMRYETSRVFKECDPIAYRVGFSDYVSSLGEEGTIVEGWQ